MRQTIDKEFTLKQLQEKAIQQNQVLYLAFVVFRKAFNTVGKALLWKVPTTFGCSP